MTNQKLSLLIASKNDTYNSTPFAETKLPIDRLGIVVSKSVEYANFYGVPLEIVVLDWGSDAPIADVLRADGDTVKHVYVPKSVTSSLKTPFHEPLALNIAAQAATGDILGRIDQDTIVGNRFWQWFRDNEVKGPFFSTRRHLIPGAWQPIDHDAPAQWPDYRDQYEWRGVGIFGMPKSLWVEAKGYDESYQFFNEMEVEFLHRVSDNGHPITYLQKLLDAPFYHIWHPTKDSDGRPRNSPPVRGRPLAANAKWGNESLGTA